MLMIHFQFAFRKFINKTSMELCNLAFHWHQDNSSSTRHYDHKWFETTIMVVWSTRCNWKLEFIAIVCIAQCNWKCNISHLTKYIGPRWTDLGQTRPTFSTGHYWGHFNSLCAEYCVLVKRKWGSFLSLFKIDVSHVVSSFSTVTSSSYVTGAMIAADNHSNWEVRESAHRIWTLYFQSRHQPFGHDKIVSE